MRKKQHQTKKTRQRIMPPDAGLTAKEMDLTQPPQTVYENFDDEQLASFSKELAKLIKKHTSQKSSHSEINEDL